MELKKCARCGCIFNTKEYVCPNCKTKDEADKMSLKNYFSNNDMPDNLEKLSLYSGVYPKNITRLMENQDFSSEIKNFKAMDSTNLSVEL